MNDAVRQYRKQWADDDLQAELCVVKLVDEEDVSAAGIIDEDLHQGCQAGQGHLYHFPHLQHHPSHHCKANGQYCHSDSPTH